MAYTIVKSDGAILTTIADGTINTTSTPLALPGRNYAGYGNAIDTNFVHLLENFADSIPPSNPLKGQLWFNTNTSVLSICPADGTTNINDWLTLAQSGSSGTTTFGNVQVAGNLVANNITALNNSNANSITCAYLTVTANANIANANVTTGVINSLTTTLITTGANTTQGTITGTWTVNGGGTANSVVGTSLWVTNGNLVITGGGSVGIRTDGYYYANGTPVSFAGTYSNSNVASYMPIYNGNILSSNIQVPIITTGANTTSGTITGNWTLTSGSRLQATYADLAERFESDDSYAPGTVVELGGIKEITAVKFELSEDIFGVISNSAAYLMNSGAGTDDTHPPVAVSGRVRVKVTGKIKKGDRLVSAGDGIARAAKRGEANAFNTIGRSLVEKGTDGIGTVEAIVSIR